MSLPAEHPQTTPTRYTVWYYFPKPICKYKDNSVVIDYSNLCLAYYPRLWLFTDLKFITGSDSIGKLRNLLLQLLIGFLKIGDLFIFDF